MGHRPDLWIELSGDEQWNGGKLVGYDAFVFATLFGALGTLVAGLRTPRGPQRHAPIPT